MRKHNRLKLDPDMEGGIAAVHEQMVHQEGECANCSVDAKEDRKKAQPQQECSPRPPHARDKSRPSREELEERRRRLALFQTQRLLLSARQYDPVEYYLLQRELRHYLRLRGGGGGGGNNVAGGGGGGREGGGGNSCAGPRREAWWRRLIGCVFKSTASSG